MNKRRWRAGERFLLGIAVVFVGNLVAAGLAPDASESMRRFDIVYRPLLCILLLLGFTFLLWWRDQVRSAPLAAMGLGLRGPWLRDCWIGLLIGSSAVVAAVVVMALAGNLTFDLRFNAHTAGTGAVVLIILLTGALAEELSFRGYPFQRLIEAVGATAAVFLLSFLFGVAHLGNPHASWWALLNTILVGVLLSLAYLRTRSLWMPWAIHFSWNTTLGFVFGLPVSGLTEFSTLVRGHTAGPVWLTGGSYGIEGSALGAGVIALASVALVFVAPRQALPAGPQTSAPTEPELPKTEVRE